MIGAKLSVVIPSFNNAGLLLECLRSVDAQTVRPAEIIVVDDGSVEALAGPLLGPFPGVRVIRLEHNRGFCRAANTGLRAASQPYVFLLNNDMWLEPDCIEQLLRSATPRTILTPLVLFKDDPDCIYSAGDRVLTNGRPESIGYRRRRDEFTLPARIATVTGGAALIPQTVLRRAGYFDESFVAYFEDADLCLRARWAGFDCALVPGAVVYHAGSASLGGNTWRRSLWCFRNHALLVLKNFPWPVMVRFLPGILGERLHQARMAFSSCRAAFGIAGAAVRFTGAAIGLFAAIPRALRSRRHLGPRSISSDDFAALLTPRSKRT